MSRRGRGSSASKKVANGPPPSHPAESNREHRKFLIRSLERNDVDMNALIEINKSLRRGKEKILQSCGQLILLDLGSGRLKLVNNELHDYCIDVKSGGVISERVNLADSRGDQFRTRYQLTTTQKDICVDFLLRMKLRQKLSSRLIRRLTRLAHAMDGKDISPPLPPKYGDLRFHIDPKNFEVWLKERKRKGDARKKIKLSIDSGVLDFEYKSELCLEKKGREKGSEEGSSDGDRNFTRKDEEEKVKDVSDVTKSSEIRTSEPIMCTSIKGSQKKLLDCGNLREKNCYSVPTLLCDFKLLREYEICYSKTWNASTKSFNFDLKKEDISDLEYKQLTKGGGIGATSIFTTPDGIKAEHKRWQTTLLRRIQEQPTADELGLEDRVFELNDRRKRCIDLMATGHDESNPPEGSTLKRGRVEEDNHDIESKNKQESGCDLEENSDNDEHEETEEQNMNPETMKLKRFISFAAIPSFYDQDFLRISMIHRDLLNSSQTEFTRKRLADATNEYNQRFQLSTQLLDTRQMVQHNLTFTIAKGRQELTKAHSDYTIAYTAAKQLWLKEKFEYDMRKSQAVLPTKWGSQPLGTEVIKQYMQSNCSNVHLITISQTLADIVDGSILAAEGKTPIQRFKDFVPPPAPGMDAKTGENMAQRQHRVEMEYRKQFNAIDAKFQKSEAERTRAWRKVMKAQAEVYSISGSNGRGSKITMSNYHQVPVPSIRSNIQQNLPNHYVQQSSKLVSYTTQVSAPATSLTDMSKYSAAKVKQRKSADGTVAPVSEPKKTKDGLYLRPAGRTRKGMQWDAVNGVWIPQRM